VKPQLIGNAYKISTYLQSIFPQGATNSEIEEATQVHPHQQVFQITRKLAEQGHLRAEQGMYRKNEWVFFAKSKSDLADGNISSPQPKVAQPVQEAGEEKLSPTEFEILAAKVLSKHYGVALSKGGVAGVPKHFDLVSGDGNVIGDAKFFTLVGGQRHPPAKFSVIAEHVWLLEKAHAKHIFLVFGNQREVPVRWLEKYGHLVQGVKFFFLDNAGELEELN
jgi:hypothetical protein